MEGKTVGDPEDGEWGAHLLPASFFVTILYISSEGSCVASDDMIPVFIGGSQEHLYNGQEENGRFLGFMQWSEEQSPPCIMPKNPWNSVWKTIWAILTWGLPMKRWQGPMPSREMNQSGTDIWIWRDKRVSE